MPDLPTTRPAAAASLDADTTPPPPTGIVTDEQREERIREEDKYQLETYGERRRIRYNANPLQEAERAAGIGYDEPAAAQYLRCPFGIRVKCEGDLLPARQGPVFVRRRVYADRVPFPGLYRLIDIPEGGVVMRVDVVFHQNQPDKTAWPPLASAWNTLGMDYEVALMTARTRPATVPVVALKSYRTEATTNYCARGTEIAKPDCIFPTTLCFAKDCEFGSS